MQLWNNYTNPVYSFDDCDNDCLNECKDTLETAIYVSSIKDCPLQDSITRCFKYFAPQWEVYVEQCALFSVSDTGLPAGSPVESEGGSSTSPPSPPPRHCLIF